MISSGEVPTAAIGALAPGTMRGIGASAGVVGVDGTLATIRDGQRQRVDGDRGLVTVIADAAAA